MVLVLLLAFVPPLINVSRFQRRIASNLSAALGRPVHLDGVTLSLLPLPGFTLENFVVDEDPSFGYEPILRANRVRATVRVSSLWSRRVEFSRISLTDPTSVNLVRLPDGRWNFESVLIQASRIEAAPTAQPFPGSAPRFPYIEADGARLNFKFGQEKMPLALTDSQFAIWLSDPGQWHFRLKTHPVRTDVSPSDAGLLRLEGTLGDSTHRPSSLAAVPIDVHASWQAAPIAGLSRLAVGKDIGLRGTADLTLHASGTAGETSIAANLKLAQIRRSDFIPPQTVNVEASCQGSASNIFQRFSDIECRWPPDAVVAPLMTASGSVPDVSDRATASAKLTLHALPSATLVEWLQAATPHPPTGFSGTGVLAGTVQWTPFAPAGGAVLSGALELSGESVKLVSPEGPSPVLLGNALLRFAPPADAVTTAPKGRHRPVGAPLPPSGPLSLRGDLLPVDLSLGGRQPAVLEGHFDSEGYTLHLTGTAMLDRLLALAGAVPQFGEGLSDALALGSAERPVSQGVSPVRLDLTARRQWGHAQIWSQTGSRPPP